MTGLMLVFGLSVFTQSKSKGTANVKTNTPDAVVKNLYAAQKSENNNPFFQSKNRGLIDKYFAKVLADMIWKDSVDAADGAGTINFDPLFYAQDSEITNFVIGKPQADGDENNSVVAVTFKNFGKAEKIVYEMHREKGVWKIKDISYSDGENLVSTLQYAQDEEFRNEYDSQPFIGEYNVGQKKCTVTPTRDGYRMRIECEGEDGFKFYEIEGSEVETAYISLDAKGVQQGKFVFKNGEDNGKFFDAKGKQSTVTKVKMQAGVCGLNLEITENNADGLPVQNVTATAMNAETKETSKATLFEAMPVFSDLSEGKYQVTVMKKGYKNATKEITLDCSNLEDDDPSVTQQIFVQKEGGKQSANQTQTDTKTNASNIRGVDFLNYTYQSTACADDLGISTAVKVKNGSFNREQNFYSVYDKKIIYGDINGDGNEDAVVKIACGSSAGTFRGFEIKVYTFENGKAKLLAQTDYQNVEKDYKKTYADGFIILINESDVKIDKDHLIFQVFADGSNASPENITTFDYKLSGTKLVLNGKPQRKRI